MIGRISQSHSGAESRGGRTGRECLECCVTEKMNLNIEGKVYKIVVRSAQQGR